MFSPIYRIRELLFQTHLLRKKSGTFLFPVKVFFLREQEVLEPLLKFIERAKKETNKIRSITIFALTMN